MVTRQEKIDKRHANAWTQIERWLEFEFKNPLKVNVVVENFQRESHKYAYTTLPKAQDDLYTVHLDYDLLAKESDTLILHSAIREALRINLLSQGVKATDTSDQYRQALAKYRLPDYAGLPENGVDCYVYRCSNCNAILAVKMRRLPKARKIAFNPLILSPCCHAVIKESDRKEHITNIMLQNIAVKLGYTVKTIGKMMSSDDTPF